MLLYDALLMGFGILRPSLSYDSNHVWVHSRQGWGGDSRSLRMSDERQDQWVEDELQLLSGILYSCQNANEVSIVLPVPFSVPMDSDGPVGEALRLIPERFRTRAVDMAREILEVDISAARKIIMAFWGLYDLEALCLIRLGQTVGSLIQRKAASKCGTRLYDKLQSLKRLCVACWCLVTGLDD